MTPGVDVPWDALLFPVAFVVPGALIATQLPRHPVGWLMLAVGACFAANAVALGWLASDRTAGSGAMEWWSDRGSAVVVPMTLLLILLIPDGRLPSARWRPVVIAVMSAQLVVIALWCLVPVLPDGWVSALEALELMLILPFLLGVAAVFQRLRTASERPPVASVLAGVLVFVLLVTVPDLVWPEASEWFHIAATAVLCGTILGAVLRGRFDRVEIVVSHTLVYSVLTVVVLVAYVGIVAATSRAGAPDQLAGLLTAGVALALLPVRRLLQRGIRRAMYGDVGEPQRALRRLSSSVAGTDDLTEVLGGLARSVRASVRAQWVSAEFRGSATTSGDVRGPATERLALDGGNGQGGLLEVGFGPGRSLRDADRGLLEDLADHGARAARVVCLAADLAQARHALVESREQERSQLRRDLHDDLGPILAGLTMQLGSLPELVGSDADLARSRLVRLEDQARSALERTRSISRDLRPAALDELGLTAAVVEVGRALGVPVRILGDLPDRPSPAVEVAAYRIAAEAIVNAQRHGDAGVVDVRMNKAPDGLTVEVVDHGRGMVVSAQGVGLRSMRVRAEELGGTFECLDTLGGGVTVRATLPEATETTEAVEA